MTLLAEGGQFDKLPCKRQNLVEKNNQWQPWPLSVFVVQELKRESMVSITISDAFNFYMLKWGKSKLFCDQNGESLDAL